MAPGDHVAPNEPVTRRSTLWLSIRHRAENWLFEIEPDEERAIVVGSLLRAHVRINRPDIAPVHFHFEREQDRVLVCPAYGADLCVNGTRISGPYELDAHAKIEFAGLELEAYVCDIEPNILEQLDLRDWTAEGLPDCGAVLSLPDGTEVTRAIPRLSRSPEGREVETKTYAPLCDSYSQQATRLNRSSTDETAPNGGFASESIVPDPVVTIGSAEHTLPGLHVVANAAAPNHGMSGYLGVDDFPSTAPVCSDPSDDVVEPAGSVFTRIGIAARERPVRIMVATCCGSVLLALAMLAASSLLPLNPGHAPEVDRQRSSTNPAPPRSSLPDSNAVPTDAAAGGTAPIITVVEPVVAGSLQPSAKRLRGSSSFKNPKSKGAATHVMSAPVTDPRISSGL